jgi:hypothetical protein
MCEVYGQCKAALLGLGQNERASEVRSKKMKQTLLGAGAALCLLSFGSPAVATGADDLVAAR